MAGADGNMAVAGGRTYVRRIFKNLRTSFKEYCKQYAEATLAPTPTLTSTLN